MRVRCVKVLGCIWLTLGKEYDVISTRGSGSDFEIKSDDGTTRFYGAEHFVFVAAPESVASLGLGPPVAEPAPLFPHDSTARKAIPIVTGLLDYFPAALAEVAKVSKKGNDKHNPGQPLHHARGKSMDHPDATVRHFMEHRADPNAVDPDSGLPVLAHAAWRILAMLQEHLEAKGAPLARGAKVTP